MKNLNYGLLAALVLTAGCVPTYQLIQPAPTYVEALELRPSQSWNKAPHSNTYNRKDSETWTQDGLILDRLLIVAGVPDGESIIKNPRKDSALPAFRSDMLPNEIEELFEATIVKLYGEGNSAVTTSNLRPHRFGDNPGVLFDIEASVTESPNYRGLVGAFIVDGELYSMLFIAVETHYYDKHIAEAEAIIKGARLAPSSTSS